MSAEAGSDLQKAQWQIAALEGRHAALTTVLVTFAAHFAAQFDDPMKVIAQAMADAEHNLHSAPAQPGAERQRAWAMAEFKTISDALLAHLTRHVAPQGRG